MLIFGWDRAFLVCRLVDWPTVSVNMWGFDDSSCASCSFKAQIGISLKIISYDANILDKKNIYHDDKVTCGGERAF
jgi:hypothetical protein